MSAQRRSHKAGIVVWRARSVDAPVSLHSARHYCQQRHLWRGNTETRRGIHGGFPPPSTERRRPLSLTEPVPSLHSVIYLSSHWSRTQTAAIIGTFPLTMCELCNGTTTIAL